MNNKQTQDLLLHGTAVSGRDSWWKSMIWAVTAPQGLSSKDWWGLSEKAPWMRLISEQSWGKQGLRLLVFKRAPQKPSLSPPSLEPTKSCEVDESASWPEGCHPWVGIQSCFNKGTVNKGKAWIKDNQQSVDHHRLDASGKPLPVGLPGVRREPLLGLGKREDCWVWAVAFKTGLWLLPTGSLAGREQRSKNPILFFLCYPLILCMCLP